MTAVLIALSLYAYFVTGVVFAFVSMRWQKVKWPNTDPDATGGWLALFGWPIVGPCMLMDILVANQTK